MKKFLNQLDSLLIDSLCGFASAHRDIVALQTDPLFIKRQVKSASSKVQLISGGGSGHEPLHTGFVGLGMLDAACPGQVFTSPTPDQMLAAAQALNHEAGILFIVKNYAGDVMNFEIAAEMLDCPVATVLVSDDVALEKNHSTGRRGVAGTVIVEKMLGAAAEAGLGLIALQALADRINQRLASMGLALSSCTVPAIGKPTFDLSEHEVEMGVGIHGERGRETQILATASDMIEQLAQHIVADLALQAGQNLLLLVNGFGATPLLELYLVYDIALRYLEQKGIKVTRSLVGNYVTSLDMAGCSLSICVLDDELLALWDAPVNTASLRWAC